MRDDKDYALITAPGWGNSRNGCGEVDDIGKLNELLPRARTFRGYWIISAHGRTVKVGQEIPYEEITNHRFTRFVDYDQPHPSLGGKRKHG